MLAAVAAVIIGLAFGIGTGIRNMFQETSNCLNARDAAVNPCTAPPGG